MPERAFFSVLSADVATSTDWYVSLFGYQVEFDSDWFVHLRDPDNPLLELGIMAIGHEIVNERMRSAPTGGSITLVVDDVDLSLEPHRPQQEAWTCRQPHRPIVLRPGCAQRRVGLEDTQLDRGHVEST